MAAFNRAAMHTTTPDCSGADPLDLDPSTAGRLLDGLGMDDVPDAYASVAQVLAAVRRPAQAEELTGEAAAVAAFAAAVSAPVVKGSTWLRGKAKAAAAVLVSGFTLTTGLAAAGALPGPAQSVASEALERVGISVPNPHDDAPPPPPAPVAKDDPAASTEAPDGTHGAEVSDTARTTEAEGRDKGAEVSGVASDGKSRAGEAPTGGAPEDRGAAGKAQAEEHKPEAPQVPEAPRGKP